MKLNIYIEDEMPNPKLSRKNIILLVTLIAILILTVIIIIVIVVNKYGGHEDDQVISLPKIGIMKQKTYSGLIKVNNETNSNLFYLFFESRNASPNTKVILWLNGGPGYSSIVDAFEQNGPFNILLDNSFVSNKFSWNEDYHILYIDSPVGAGYSFTDSDKGYPNSSRIVAENIYVALKVFFQKHKQYSTLDFVAAGISYGGKYIPYLCDYILKQENPVVNLTKAIIANGWTNPLHQVESYLPFLNQNYRLHPSDNLSHIDYLLNNWRDSINEENYTQAFYFEDSLNQYFASLPNIKSMYNIIHHDEKYGDLESYFNEEGVKKSLHVPKEIHFAEFNQSSMDALDDDEERDASYLLPFLLEKIPILFYNGDKDLICNFVGTVSFLERLNWTFSDEFVNAMNFTWIYKDSDRTRFAGLYKKKQNLMYASVFDSGHSAATDKPAEVYHLISNFIDDKWNDTDSSQFENYFSNFNSNNLKKRVFS